MSLSLCDSLARRMVSIFIRSPLNRFPEEVTCELTGDKLRPFFFLRTSTLLFPLARQYEWRNKLTPESSGASQCNIIDLYFAECDYPEL